MHVSDAHASIVSLCYMHKFGEIAIENEIEITSTFVTLLNSVSTDSRADLTYSNGR